MLTADGRVSEAPIACFFMVREGRLITPSTSSGILESITRATIITRWRERTGGEVEQRDVDRSELYFAEEAFLCGTGQEILPVTQIDRLPVGNGEVGPVTRQVREDYFNIVRGRVPDHPEWRTLV
jgi:branched-chain amino acid aminotransferase